MPTMRQLEIFVEAVADLHFRVTADRLGISQPAVSRQIAALEAEIGFALFDRRAGRSPALSAAGCAFIVRAEAALSAHSSLVSPDLGRLPPVRIGLRHHLLEAHVRPRLPAFADAHPDCHLAFTVLDDVGELATRIRRGEIDHGLFRGDDPKAGGVTAEPLASVRCGIFAAGPLYERWHDDLGRLDTAPFLHLGSAEQAGPDMIADRLREVGVTPSGWVGHTQFPQILAQWCAEGRGLAVLLEEDIGQAIAEGRLLKLNVPLRAVDTILLSRSGARPVPAAVRALLAGGPLR